jgi:hypothetical protein
MSLNYLDDFFADIEITSLVFLFPFLIWNQTLSFSLIVASFWGTQFLIISINSFVNTSQFSCSYFMEMQYEFQSKDDVHLLHVSKSVIRKSQTNRLYVLIDLRGTCK